MRSTALWLSSAIVYLAISACGREEQASSELDWWWPEKTYETTSNLYLETFDGTQLVSQIHEPKEKFFPGDRPALIFANSWTLNEYEYILQAKKFAEKGYIVLSYATRGFGRSGGVASAAGPDDIRDVSSIIDWMEANTRVDISRIGMVGVSYGGGIGLLALAQDERIFTTAALSGWADLEKALYGNDTTRKVWIDLLIGSGKLTGRLDPEFQVVYNNLKVQENVEYTREWARARSVVRMIESINKRKAPVFMANSYRDNLFPPNQALEFFSKLETTKKIYLNKGIHASAEVPGIFGLESEIWSDVHNWFDHWFENPSFTVSEDLPYTLQVEDGRESYARLPDARAKKGEWHLEPVNQIRAGLGYEDDALPGVVVESGWDSGASTGIPLLSSVLDSHTPIKVKKWLPLINQKHGAVYYSQAVNRSVAIRGVPRVDMLLTPMSESLQLVTYLYEVDPWGVGTLITHGVTTLRDLQLGQTMAIDLELSAISYDVKPNRKLGVVIDTYDPLYGRPGGGQFSFQIAHSDMASLQVHLPEPN
ncbi:CocE/NonD family hydrolase [Pseudobacteriovorax antillogorgiicola]|uniref:Predicted acyl esterase n=1 Tax=Pseudobacteriovorax antillogorgiicola TaxID=1513793 RepID=A0A1Y6C617_9BACT|nr:CocE/NonD family hydrolase [Pseudobacteriovorax antillogorgiicola]TCS49376.1 putative acyl esterase [Pseudobacteriovorax antillogorgiicola]SMF47371.1 Predicted acyl esterase [Pseudobacteriovorax antillogorgiicola]